MKITLKLPDGAKRVATVPFTGAEHVIVNNTECPNPECRGYSVRGNGKNRIETDWTEEEDAVCAAGACGEPRGRLYVVLETLFGREEDNRVLNGRWRVY
jgi:hypothetical protein